MLHTLLAGLESPIYQLAWGILCNPEDEPVVTLIHAANTEEAILLKKNFDRFEQNFPGKFEAVYAVMRPPKGSKFYKGRVSKQLLEVVTHSSPSKEDMVFLFWLASY